MQQNKLITVKQFFDEVDAHFCIPIRCSSFHRLACRYAREEGWVRCETMSLFARLEDHRRIAPGWEDEKPYALLPGWEQEKANMDFVVTLREGQTVFQLKALCLDVPEQHRDPKYVQHTWVNEDPRRIAFYLGRKTSMVGKDSFMAYIWLVLYRWAATACCSSILVLMRKSGARHLAT
jgi:hypothetical protein